MLRRFSAPRLWLHDLMLGLNARRSRRAGARIAWACVIAAAIALGPISAPAVGGPSVNVWAPQFMGYGTDGNYSAYNPEKFPIVAASNPTLYNLGDQIAASTRVVYLNGVMLTSVDLGSNGDHSGTYPESAYAHTSDGQRIHPRTFPGNTLMNPTDDVWRNSLTKKCRFLLATYGWDGCFFDSLGSSTLSGNYLVPGPPVDTRTGATWTAADWLAAMSDNMGLVRTGNPGALIFGNGLRSGATYFGSPPSSALWTNLDGAMAEFFTKDPIYPPSESESDWRKNVSMLVDANRRQKTIFVTTKSWESPAATQAEKDAWHKYALATFLLGSYSRSYFSFQYTHTKTSPSEYHPWWDTDIGAPSGDYAKLRGVYQRSFTKGRVLVNPDATHTFTIDLGGWYTPLGSSTAIDSITLGPRTGEVLVAA